MTTWTKIESEIIKDFETFANQVKNLAPQNSTYISKHNGKVVNYIFVEGKRVKTNSNRLYESINTKMSRQGNDLTLEVVAGEGINYYEKAVLHKNRKVAYHYSRTEYGSKRYEGSKVVNKENTNYLYYMNGVSFMQQFISKYNGKIYRVKGEIPKWQVKTY